MSYFGGKRLQLKKFFVGEVCDGPGWGGYKGRGAEKLWGGLSERPPLPPMPLKGEVISPLQPHRASSPSLSSPDEGL